MILNGTDLNATEHTLGVDRETYPDGTRAIFATCSCGWTGAHALTFEHANRAHGRDYLRRPDMTDAEIVAYLDGGHHHDTVAYYREARALARINADA